MSRAAISKPNQRTGCNTGWTRETAAECTGAKGCEPRAWHAQPTPFSLWDPKKVCALVTILYLAHLLTDMVWW